MEDFDIFEIIGKDTLPKIGRSISHKQALLTVFQNRAVFNKAAEIAFDLKPSSKILLLTGTNKRMYICLDCGEYTGGFQLESGTKMLTFGSVTESVRWAELYGMPTKINEFKKFRFVISTETKATTVTDKLTGKTLSLEFHALTLQQEPQAENTRPYTPATFTKENGGVKQELKRINHVAREAE